MATRYGWNQYLLHDDFYDDDGVACQPEEDVDDPASSPFPTPAEYAASLALAIDVAFAKWHLPEALLPLLAARPPETIAALETALAERRNLDFESRAYEIAARALGPHAADWIRQRWKVVPAEGSVVALAEASAACLPPPEGLALVESVLREMEPNKRRDCLWAMAYFRDRRALSFIEEFAAPPTTDIWGRVAACSRFSWDVAEAWLQRGRPLSLVALDALGFSFIYDTVELRRMLPTLENPPDPETLERTLRQHAVRDPAWRVESQVNLLLKNLTKISSPKPSGQKANQ